MLATAFFEDAIGNAKPYKQKFIYMDANTGNILGVAVLPKCCKKFFGPDAITMSFNGSRIFTLGNQENTQAALVGFSFNGANFVETGWQRWFLDNVIATEFTKLSVTLSTDETHVVTFSTGR